MWTWLSVSYSSVAPETTLSSGITGASTSITVGSVTGFPSNTPYTLALDYEGITEELVQVNNAAGTTLTIARAIDGTSAASHNAGARVRHVSSARDFADSRSHENSDQGIHGLAPGDVLVGEDAVQTLTNKTLVSPTVSGTIAGSPNFSGTWTGNPVVGAKVRLQNTSDVSATSTDHAFQIGLDNSQNLRMDNNEIQAINNGVGSQLLLQADSIQTSFMVNAGVDNTTSAITANGTVQGNIIRSDRPAGTATTFIARTTGDANGRWFTLANGANRWSDGTAASDAGISRTAPGVLTVDNSLAITNGLTVPNISSSGTSSFVNLTVTGNFNPPQTTASGATIGTAGAGWSLVGINGFMIGGTTFVTGVVNRTGASINPTTTAPDAGQVPDTTMVTITPAWRPNVGYPSAIACPITDGIGFGGCRLNTDGTVDLVSWLPNNQITSGGGANLRFSLSYPSA